MYRHTHKSKGQSIKIVLNTYKIKDACYSRRKKDRRKQKQTKRNDSDSIELRALRKAKSVVLPLLLLQHKTLAPMWKKDRLENIRSDSDCISMVCVCVIYAIIDNLHQLEKYWKQKKEKIVVMPLATINWKECEIFQF